MLSLALVLASALSAFSPPDSYIDIETAARAAFRAYIDGETVPGWRQQPLKRLGLPDQFIDSRVYYKNGSASATVLLNEQEHLAIISFRGTDELRGSNSDLIAYMKSLCKNNTYPLNFLPLFKAFAKTYGDTYRVTFVGHSLGGAAVNQLAKQIEDDFYPKTWRWMDTADFYAFASPCIKSNKEKTIVNYGHDNEPVYLFKGRPEGRDYLFMNVFHRTNLHLLTTGWTDLSLKESPHGISSIIKGMDRLSLIDAPKYIREWKPTTIIVDSKKQNIADFGQLPDEGRSIVGSSQPNRDRPILVVGEDTQVRDVFQLSIFDDFRPVMMIGLGGPDWLKGGRDNDVLFGDAPGWAYGDTTYVALTDEPAVQAKFGAMKGNDTLFGYGGEDVLVGGDGDDLLDGGQDGDALFGGNGNDVLRGGGASTAADYLYGGPGNDTITAGYGGGWGSNWLFGDEGDDRLIGGPERDTIEGGDGDDWIEGGNVGDDLRGGAGNDYIAGGDYPDMIFGGDGVDVIEGGEGGDTLYGDAGADKLSGGPGGDVYYADKEDTLVDDDCWNLVNTTSDTVRLADMRFASSVYVQNDLPTSIDTSGFFMPTEACPTPQLTLRGAAAVVTMSLDSSFQNGNIVVYGDKRIVIKADFASYDGNRPGLTLWDGSIDLSGFQLGGVWTSKGRCPADTMLRLERGTTIVKVQTMGSDDNEYCGIVDEMWLFSNAVPVSRILF